MSLQVRRQIEEEMQREAKIDKTIESMKKRIMKNHANRRYRILPNNKGANAALVIDRSDLSRYNIVLYEENNEILDSFKNNPKFSMIFLKNKNPHDTRLTTYGDIRAMPRVS